MQIVIFCEKRKYIKELRCVAALICSVLGMEDKDEFTGRKVGRKYGEAYYRGG